MAKSPTKYPVPSFYFSVDFGGGNALSFKEISGLKFDIAYKDKPRQGGDSVTQHKVFDKVEHSSVTLKKGLFKQDSIAIEIIEKIFGISLLNSTTAQTLKPQTVNIILKDEKGQPTLMITLIGAYPKLWEISTFDAMSKEISMETLNLEYRSMRIMYSS